MKRTFLLVLVIVLAQIYGTNTLNPFERGCVSEDINLLYKQIVSFNMEHNINSECKIIENSIDCQLKEIPTLSILCEDNECYVSFLDKREKIENFMPTEKMAAMLCRAIFKVECSCSKVDVNKIDCKIPIKSTKINCDGKTGCEISMGSSSHYIPYCSSENNEDIDDENLVGESINNNLNLEYNDKEGSVKLSSEDYSFNIKYKNNSNLRMSINNLKLEELTNPAKVEKKYNSILKKQMENFKSIQIIKAVNFTHPADYNDEIKEVVIQFKISKNDVGNNKLIVLHENEDHKLEVYDNFNVEEKGDYIIITLKTKGLSIYSVATVEMISDENNSETNNENSLCMSTGLILLSMVGALLVNNF